MHSYCRRATNFMVFCHVDPSPCLGERVVAYNSSKRDITISAWHTICAKKNVLNFAPVVFCSRCGRECEKNATKTNACLGEKFYQLRRRKCFLFHSFCEPPMRLKRGCGSRCDVRWLLNQQQSTVDGLGKVFGFCLFMVTWSFVSSNFERDEFCLIFIHSYIDNVILNKNVKTFFKKS